MESSKSGFEYTKTIFRENLIEIVVEIYAQPNKKERKSNQKGRKKIRWY